MFTHTPTGPPLPGNSYARGNFGVVFVKDSTPSECSADPSRFCAT